jgi:hypothetical protein
MSESVAVDNAEPEVSAETNDAQEDLDTLLGQFDEGTSQPASTEAETGGQQNVVTREEFAELQNTLVNQQYQTDIQSVTKVIKGDIDVPYVDDSFVETWLNTEANKNPKLAQAWASRHSNPDAFQKVTNSLAKQFQAKFNIDHKVTSDMDSITSAVRSASTKGPEPETPRDWSAMSDAEFAAEKAKLRRG